MTDFRSFDGYSMRTASLADRPVKSIQAWKKPKVENTNAEKEILAKLNDIADGERTKHIMAYAPDHSRSGSEQKDAYGFSDVIDVINPLHHLPLVGMVYRELTGDQIHPMSQIVGGAIYGGPVGAISGTANAISQERTGKDLGDHVMEFAGFDLKTEAEEQAYQQKVNETRAALIDLQEDIQKEDMTEISLSAMPPKRQG